MEQATARRSDGFRERGQQVTRLETFVDAAFAFAVTLLLISVGDVPDSIGGLLDALRRVPAFAAAFALICMFWWAHNTWSRRYGLDDLPTLLLSLLFVFLALIYVYPLRMLFEGFFAWVSGGALPSTVTVASLAELRAMYVVYGACFATMGLTLAALYAHAFRRRAAIGLDAHEQVETLGEIASRAWLACNGLLSIAVALLLPERAPGWVYALPGTMYFSMFLTGPVVRLVVRRAAPRYGLAAP
jgi:uncharacterized membrane protein